MPILHYILVDRKPVVEPDIEKWCRWMEDFGNRRVRKTELPSGVSVSTVFLGLDYRFLEPGPPLVFETFIFGGKHADKMWRFSTWEEAEKGHENALRLARSAEWKVIYGGKCEGAN